MKTSREFFSMYVRTRGDKTSFGRVFSFYKRLVLCCGYCVWAESLLSHKNPVAFASGIESQSTFRTQD